MLLNSVEFSHFNDTTLVSAISLHTRVDQYNRVFTDDLLSRVDQYNRVFTDDVLSRVDQYNRVFTDVCCLGWTNIIWPSQMIFV